MESAYKCKISIGTVKIGEMNKENLPGMTNIIIDSTVFQDEFEKFVYGNTKGGQATFSGFMADGDTTGQDVITAAYVDQTNIANLRVWYGTGVADFFHLTAGATCFVESLQIGEADLSGLVPITFTLTVSDGYFVKASAYREGTLAFAHVTGANNDTITRSTGTSFITLGFAAGQNLIVEGSALNDGNYIIYSVSSTIITVTSDALQDESPATVVSLIALPA
jgi:hypothetical protein